jgi:nucleotide-binding universal stress UspA family protein
MSTSNNARVLVATDFSEVSDEALRQGDALARRDNAKLGVVHAIPDIQEINSLFPQQNAGAELQMTDLTGRVHALLDERITTVTKRDPKTVDRFVEVGLDYAEVVKRAEAYKPSVLVVGSIGRTGLARALMGSVATKIVRFAHCPVLVVRPSSAKGIVLAATDMSEPSIHALKVAAEEASRRGAELVVAHAIDFRAAALFGELGSFFGGVAQTNDVAAAIETTKTALAAWLSSQGIKASAVVLNGSAAAALCEHADKIGAELVVVASHGRTGLARLALGSVAENIVRHAPCSAYVVRLA